MIDFSWDAYYEDVEGDYSLSDRVFSLHAALCDKKFAKKAQNKLDLLKDRFFSQEWLQKNDIEDIDARFHIMLVADMQTHKKRFVLAYMPLESDVEKVDDAKLLVTNDSKNTVGEKITLKEFKDRLMSGEYKIVNECQSADNNTLKQRIDDYVKTPTELMINK